MSTLLSPSVARAVAGGSAIRKMFEQGIELKKKFGADNVYDFSLGNPDLAPPPAVKAALEKVAAAADRPFALGYMPNAGYPATREALARLVSREQGVETPAANVVVTVGAAGGLNVLFRAVLSPGDEVLVPSPYFVEYGNYVGNFGGVLTPVPTKPGDFSLDVAAIDAAIAAVNEYRSREGVALHRDVTSRVATIGALYDEVEALEGERIETVKGKLLKALDELQAKPDPSRFEQELIFYLEKYDINEEKVRLRQHCKYFMDTIDGEPAPGKKLGFIIQEMGREINTTGSKANHAGIQRLVVRLKDELEKIREQSMHIL